MEDDYDEYHKKENEKQEDIMKKEKEQKKLFGEEDAGE